MSDMEALFKKAVKQNKEEKKRSEQGGGFTPTDRELVQWSALEANQFKLVRFLGKPIELRESSAFPELTPYSPKTIYSSMIVGDDGKKFRCIFPSKQENKGWILWKVMNKVLSYDWNPNKGERGEKEYRYKDDFPSLFQRVAKNDKVENTYETGWRPSGYIVQNIIDRTPESYEWHKKNKKTMLLSKKASPIGDTGNYFYEPGYPPTLYGRGNSDESGEVSGIMEVVESNGDFNLYDIVVQKLSIKPYYKVFHPVEEYKKLLAKFDGDEDALVEGIPGFDSSVVERPLTEEEKTWEWYNLDERFQVTAYTKIKNRLGVFIQDVDKKLNTHFYQELENLVAEEQKEWEKNKKEENTSTTVTKEKEVETKSEESDNKEADEEPKTRKRRGSEIKEESEFSVEKILREHSELKGADHMTPEMKALVKEVVYNEDGTVKNFKYSTDEDVFDCVNADEGCTMTAPESFTHCPLCGESFD